MSRLLVALMIVIGLVVPAHAKKKKQLPVPPAAVSTVPAVTPEDTLVLQLSTGGTVRIQLRPDQAPNHVTRIKTLTRAGFYDGLLFHRVIDGFMAQTGDPQGTGQGGSPLPDLKAEFNILPHVRGTMSMARADDVNSANSQFFIVFQPTLRLDGKYTPVGRVISNMMYVDLVERGEPPANPSRILRAFIEADGPNAQRVPLPAVAVTPPVTPAPPAPAPAPVN